MDLQSQLQAQMLAILGEEKPEPKPEPKPQILVNGYGIDNPYVFSLITAQTGCWGKFKKNDNTCKTCPLSSLCESHTVLTKEANKEQRDLKKDLKEWFSNRGIDLKKIKLNKDASIETGKSFNALDDTFCILTGLEIKQNDECYIIDRCGLVHTKTFEYLNNK
jgi:hypothetical protein